MALRPSCDQFDEQFSRDIEPMRGGHGDNFYYQLVAGIRRYKGVPPIPPVTPGQSRSTAASTTGKPSGQNFSTAGATRPREIIRAWAKRGPTSTRAAATTYGVAKVSWDEANLYFYIRTRHTITPHTDPNWMLLFLDIDANPATGWLGYDFVVNRTNVRPQTTTLERCLGGYRWGEPVDIPYRVSGNEMELAIPAGSPWADEAAGHDRFQVGR